VARVSSVGISKRSDNSPSPGKNVKFARTLHIHVCARERLYVYVCTCMDVSVYMYNAKGTVPVAENLYSI